jgi:pre-mRNA-processing factor 6
MLLALTHIPSSVRLWKAAVDLETDPEDARLLLSKAVETVPLASELWLALARLSTPEEARKVLNKARSTIPTSHEIWIAAARLREQEDGDFSAVNTIISRAVDSLNKKGGGISKEAWVKEAERCEKQGSVLTCRSIIENCIMMDVEEEDRESQWIEDAEIALREGYVETARAIYAFALRVFPKKEGLWWKAAELERSQGRRYMISLRVLDAGLDADTLRTERP